MSPEIGPSVEFDTQSGRVRGTRDAIGAHFYAVPYAAPPVGPGRFAAPQQVAPWPGLWDATRPGPVAAQGNPQPVLVGDQPAVPTEDALRVDIHSPDVGGTHPILVWLHGGGFTSGAASAAIHDPRRLAYEERIVVVCAGYRLGAPGWVDFRRHIPDAVANAGLRDQLAAIDWTRTHASQFGGDAQRVTIGGQSAGAMSAATLACAGHLSTRARRVLCSSGAVANCISRQHAADYADALVDQLEAPSASALRETSPSALQRALKAVNDARPSGDRHRLDQPLLPFGPIIDGEFLSDDPLVLAEESLPELEFMIGSNRDDAAMLFAPPDGQTRESLLEQARAVSADPDALVTAALEDARGDANGALHRLRTDVYFTAPARTLADRLADRSFVYQFGWPSPVGVGACHGLQVPFFMDNLAAAGPFGVLLGSAPPAWLARDARQALGRFVRDGFIGGAAAGWTRWDDGRSPLMLGFQPGTEPGQSADSRLDLLR